MSFFSFIALNSFSSTFIGLISMDIFSVSAHKTVKIMKAETIHNSDPQCILSPWNWAWHIVGSQEGS